MNFRDEDGQFRFRLLDGAGQQLLLSNSFGHAQEAGAVIKRLQAGELDALTTVQSDRVQVVVEGIVVAEISADDFAAVREALASFEQA